MGLLFYVGLEWHNYCYVLSLPDINVVAALSGHGRASLFAVPFRVRGGGCFAYCLRHVASGGSLIQQRTLRYRRKVNK
jgi:hypothetical protein